MLGFKYIHACLQATCLDRYMHKYMHKILDTLKWSCISSRCLLVHSQREGVKRLFKKINSYRPAHIHPVPFGWLGLLTEICACWICLPLLGDAIFYPHLSCKLSSKLFPVAGAELGTPLRMRCTML